MVSPCLVAEGSSIVIRPLLTGEQKEGLHSGPNSIAEVGQAGPDSERPTLKQRHLTLIFGTAAALAARGADHGQHGQRPQRRLPPSSGLE